jgi:hypothetical protein
MLHPINLIANLIRQHLPEICFSITAVSLMLAGPAMNGMIERLMQKFHWLLRYLVFVLMCTIGYGFLTQLAYHGIKSWFSYQRNLALVLITAGIYLVLAFFAKKQGRI